jgi:hypothetical protein
MALLSTTKKNCLNRDILAFLYFREPFYLRNIGLDADIVLTFCVASSAMYLASRTSLEEES